MALPLKVRLTLVITSLFVGNLVISTTRLTPLKRRSFGISSKIIGSVTLCMAALFVGWRRYSRLKSEIVRHLRRR